jgi:hypothetical protein
MQSFIYRRSANGENWKAVSKGLPESTGTLITILASNPINSGEFFGKNKP